MSSLFGPDSPGVVAPVDDVFRCDIAVIGSGMGGGTLAYALRETGARVLVVERGDFLPREDANWSPVEVFQKGRYKNAEQWLDAATGQPFSPGVHYYVGGNTKVYGACLPRFRAEDFGDIKTHDGISPAWPVAYDQMEPYYGQAEVLYGVHGNRGEDPTDPPRSADFPFPALDHEPPIAALAAALSAQGLRPIHMPMGVDVRSGGACVRSRTCDGFPCLRDAKGDAEVRALRPALRGPNVRLLTRTAIHRLHTSLDGGRVVAATGERDGRVVEIRAEKFVLACGAVNSAALLLKSACERHPRGLGNSSDLVGRNYMVHNSTFLIAVDPRRRNTVDFQKTLGLSDWYLAGPDNTCPLGNVQMLGKLQGPMVKSARTWVPMPILDQLAAHSVDFYLTTEDIPDPQNRIIVRSDGTIAVHWTPNNLTPHRELVRRMRSAVRRAGFPIVFSERMGIATNSHQCGTVVMGTDPGASVLDPHCRAHDVDNLWVADSACFPSSAALNPALTIAANAFRVAAESTLAH